MMAHQVCKWEEEEKEEEEEDMGWGRKSANYGMM
jgi:hypothetical protein